MSAFASVASAKVLKLFILAVTTPILVRILGPRRYGEYAAVMALFGMLMILASSGISSGGQKFLAEERDVEKWREYVFSYLLRIATILALFASVFLLLVTETGLLEIAFEPHYATYLYLLAVLTFAAQYREFVRRSLMGLKLEHLSEPLSVLHKVGFGVFAIAFAALGYGVAGVLVGHIISSFLVIGVGIVMIARELELRTVLRPLPKEFPRRELLDFNNYSIIFFFFLTSLYHVDVLMLEFFTSSDTVGYYKAALVVAEFLWFVPKSIQAVMIQSTADLWANDQIERINSLSSTVTRYTLLLSILLAIGIGALASDFIPLYFGSEFKPSVLPLLLLLPGTVGFAMARPILAITHAKGSMRILILATGTSAAINLLLNLLLIPPYGMAGAAVATSIGYGSLPVFHVIGARNIGYQPLTDVRLVPVAATTSGGLIGIWGIATLIDSSLLALLIVPPSGFLLFCLLAILTSAVSVREVTNILSGLPGTPGRTAAAIEQRIR